MRTRRARPVRFSVSRVALVGHRRRTLWPGLKNILPPQHLGALHVADLDGDVFDAAGDDAQRGEIHGVAVAGMTWVETGSGSRPSICRHIPRPRGSMWQGADGPEMAPVATSSRAISKGRDARHFGIEAGEGPAHGGRLGVDAVAAADADGVPCAQARFQRRQRGPYRPAECRRRRNKLHVQRGVQHVRRRHALMDKARLVRADMLGQVGQEGDDVVLWSRPRSRRWGDVEFDIPRLPDGFGISRADDARSVCASQAWASLDFIPDAEFGFGRPDGGHSRTGIARIIGFSCICGLCSPMPLCPQPRAREDGPATPIGRLPGAARPNSGRLRDGGKMTPIEPVYSTPVLPAIAALAVLLLLILIMRFRLHAFVRWCWSACRRRWQPGCPAPRWCRRYGWRLWRHAGLGRALLVGFGAMIGRMLEVSGGAQVLADRLINKFGADRAPLALGVASLMFGFSDLFDAGLVVMRRSSSAWRCALAARS